MMQEYCFGYSPIACHAFNGDRTQIALSLNSNEVEIHVLKSGKWHKEQTLEEHTERVTSVDWAPRTDRLVTAGADRNAHVWTRDESGQFRPMLVLLRIDRAATVARWSPNEDKFAVGSGAKLISVCNFEVEHNWWICKQIRKPFKSTVTSLDWHPNNCLLAAGSTDFKVRIVSAYLKDTDKRPEATCWGKDSKFGSVLSEVSNGGSGWIRDVSFSHDGNVLAWVAHDSSISVVDGTTGAVVVLPHNFLPFLSVTWASPNSLLAAGHDCCPMIVRYERGSLSKPVQINLKNETKGSKITAKSIFQNIDKMATDEKVEKLDSVHQNSIVQIRIHSGDKGRIDTFSTVGVDGRMVVWNTKTIEQQMAGLRI